MTSLQGWELDFSTHYLVIEKGGRVGMGARSRRSRRSRSRRRMPACTASFFYFVFIDMDVVDSAVPCILAAFSFQSFCLSSSPRMIM